MVRVKKGTSGRIVGPSKSHPASMIRVAFRDGEEVAGPIWNLLPSTVILEQPHEVMIEVGGLTGIEKCKDVQDIAEIVCAAKIEDFQVTVKRLLICARRIEGGAWTRDLVFQCKFCTRSQNKSLWACTFSA